MVGKFRSGGDEVRLFGFSANLWDFPDLFLQCNLIGNSLQEEGICVETHAVVSRYE